MYGALFSKQAEIYKAFAHPRRLEIIQLLRDQELPVTDIFTMLDLPQANISQHLMVLRDAGIVVTRKDGKQVYYSLQEELVLTVYDLVRQLAMNSSKKYQQAQEAQLPFDQLLPLATDPVCGMRVSPKLAEFSYAENDERYYFCASGCHKVFVERRKEHDS